MAQKIQWRWFGFGSIRERLQRSRPGTATTRSGSPKSRPGTACSSVSSEPARHTARLMRSNCKSHILKRFKQAGKALLMRSNCKSHHSLFHLQTQAQPVRVDLALQAVIQADLVLPLSSVLDRLRRAGQQQQSVTAAGQAQLLPPSRNRCEAGVIECSTSCVRVRAMIAEVGIMVHV